MKKLSRLILHYSTFKLLIKFLVIGRDHEQDLYGCLLAHQRVKLTRKKTDEFSLLCENFYCLQLFENYSNIQKLPTYLVQNMVISLPVLNCSVLDLDWHVFGSLESGSIIICTDPDPSIRKQNNLDKPRFTLFCDFSNDMRFCTYRKKLALKTWKITHFCWHLEFYCQKEKDPDPELHP